MGMGHLTRREFLRQSAIVAAAGAATPWWAPGFMKREYRAMTEGMVAFPQGTTYEMAVRPRGAPYLPLREGEGFPLIVRDDLGTVGRDNRELRRVGLVSILHVTDVQVPDAQSTGRVEWLGRYEPVRPAFRPQETVINQVSEAAIRQARRVGRGPVTGRPYDFAVSTGDNIDNMQENELRWFFALLDGGPIVPNSGDLTRYEGVQQYWRHTGLPFAGGYDDFYYRPDEPPEGFTPDWFKTAGGFPTLNGMLQSAIQPFQAVGVGCPWYSIYGNHDSMVQGTAGMDPLFEEMAVGGRKIIGFPPKYQWSVIGVAMLISDLLTEQLTENDILQAPALDVTPDPGRRLVGAHDYVRAHWELSSGFPRGHGLTEDNLGDGATPGERNRNTTLYYTFRPVAGTPILGIALDTANRFGLAEGSIGTRQFAWLEARLQEVHSRWFDASGQLQHGTADDQLVLLFAHHNFNSMDSELPSPDDPIRVPTAQLRDLFHRYPNVIGFVNGHSHINRVWARHDPAGRTQGFWEISTSAQLDYPMQVRVIEVADNRDDTLSIFCSLIDGGGPADPRDAFGQPGGNYDVFELASYGRELGYNDPREHESGDPFARRVGQPFDRNVELVVTSPFPLDLPKGAPVPARQRARA